MHDINAKARAACADAFNELIEGARQLYERFDKQIADIELEFTEEYQKRTDFYFSGPPKLPTFDVAELERTIAEHEDAFRPGTELQVAAE